MAMAKDATGTTILAITYHEVTLDGRVFKQAKALHRRGYRVVVACRHLPDYLKEETVDGIEIFRFPCFAWDDAAETDLAFFPFLTTSAPLVAERYTPYARAAKAYMSVSWAREWGETTFQKHDRAVAARAEGADQPKSFWETIREGTARLITLRNTMLSAAKAVNARIAEQRHILESAGVRNAHPDTSAIELRWIRETLPGLKAKVKRGCALRDALKDLCAELDAEITRQTSLEGEGIAAAEDSRHAQLDAAQEIALRALYQQSAKDARSWLAAEKTRLGRELTAARGQLFQAESITIGMNLLRETLPCTPDIIHAHDAVTLPGAVALSKRTGARVLYDAHEYEPGRATKIPPEGNQLIDLLERDCLAHVDRMTTVGQAIADLYAERFPGPAPDLVMNAPEFEMEVFSDSANDTSYPGLRQKTGLGAAAKIVVFTGGSQREKRGLHLVCAALRDLPDTYLVVLGPRHQHDDAWLRDEARAVGTEDRLILLDPVSPRDVVAAIRDADLAICPIQDAGVSYRFAMPNKLFEAAFARLPIVVSDLPEMAGFVRRYGNGVVVDQTDWKSIAGGVREVLANRRSYQLSDEAILRLAAEYGWDVQEERLAGVIADLVAVGPRGGAERLGLCGLSGRATVKSVDIAAQSGRQSCAKH